MQAGALIGDDWTFGTLSDDAGPVPWGAPEPKGSDCGCGGGCGSGSGCKGQGGNAAELTGLAQGVVGRLEERDEMGEVWDQGSLLADFSTKLTDYWPSLMSAPESLHACHSSGYQVHL